MSKVSVEYDRLKVSANFREGQIGKTPEYITTLAHRHDVVQAIATLQGIKKPRLERKEITARDGSAHEYLVVRKGRKRFLFDMPEDPTTQQEPSDMVLVVPHQTMQEKGLIPEGNGFNVFHNNKEARQLVRRIRREGYFAGRRSGASVDSACNTDFLQIVSAMVVLTKKPDDNILFANRGQIHNDSLALKTTPFPVMGHNEYADAGHPLSNIARYALLREANEEVVLRDGRTHQTSHIFSGDRVTLLGDLMLRRHYSIKPFGVIHREDTDVDQLHEGIIFIAEPRTNHTTLALNGNSQESTHVMWQTPQEYTRAVARGEQHPASWNQPVLDALRARRSK